MRAAGDGTDKGATLAEAISLTPEYGDSSA
jgi:hypothetical protein